MFFPNVDAKSLYVPGANMSLQGSLYNMAKRTLVRNMDRIEDVGNIPYVIVEPVLQRIERPAQLRDIERRSPHIQGLTADIWLRFVKRDIPQWQKRLVIPTDPKEWPFVYMDLKAEDAKSAADARQKLNQALAQREDEIYQKSTVVVQHPPSKKKTPAPWARHLPVNRASSPPGRKLYQPKHPRSDDPPKAEKAVRKRLKLNPNPLMVMAMSRPKTASSSSGGNPAAPSSSRGRPSTLPPARAATDRTAPRSIPEAAPRRTIPRLDSSSSGGTPPSISPGRSDGHPTASVNKQISPSASDSSAGAKKPKSMTFDKKPAEALSNGSAPGSPPSKNLPMLIRYRKVEIKKVVRKSKVS